MIGDIVVKAVVPRPTLDRQIPPAFHVAPIPGVLGLERQNHLRRRVDRMFAVSPEADEVQEVVVVERRRVAEVVGLGEPIARRRERPHTRHGLVGSEVDADFRQFFHFAIG